MNNLEQLNEKIEANKDVLKVLPKNNLKNINIYMKKLESLKEEFFKYEEIALKEIEKRYDENKVEYVEKKGTLNKELKKYDDFLFLLDDEKSAVEKMKLDELLQNLKYYYKNNLEIVNENIIEIYKEFKKVGIILSSKDFVYNNYVQEYISVLFENIKNGDKIGDINSENIKEKFDEIYWKCPNLITQIELNVRYIYLKNENKINKFYRKQRKNILKNDKKEDIYNKYYELEKKIIEKEKNNKNKIICSFLNGTKNIKDYEPQAIKKIYLEFVSEDVYNNASEKELNDIDLNIFKLRNSVYEYKNYLKFKFIIDNIKSIYNENKQNKNQYKVEYKKFRKLIAKKEKKVISINKMINKSFLLKGLENMKKEKVLGNQSNLISEIKDLYKELYSNKMKNMICNKIKDKDNIFDILNFSSSFYTYLMMLCRESKFQNQETDDKEIKKFIYELRDFITWPYITMINNININDTTTDFVYIIKDKYQLLNLNISKDDLDESNLDQIISKAEMIETAHIMKKEKINVSDIESLCSYKKILKK